MVIVMDKMKEHSCAIQPAFGYGGGGVGLFANFTWMVEQVFNTENLVSPVDDDPILNDVLMNDDPIMNFPSIGEMFPVITNAQLTTGPTNTFTHSFLTTEQAHQGTNTGNQQPQNPTTHQVHQTETVVNESNTTLQIHVNLSDAIQNAFLQHLTTTPLLPPIGTPGINHTFQFQTFNDAPGTASISVGGSQHHNGTLPNQSQTHISGAPAAAVHSVAAGHELVSTIIGGPMGQLHPQLASQSSANSQLVEFSTVLLNNINSQVSPDEESNSSIPPFHAPVSSPVHTLFPNNFNSSDDEGYAASAASNIIIIDSAENSDNVSENQINNPDVPN